MDFRTESLAEYFVCCSLRNQNCFIAILMIVIGMAIMPLQCLAVQPFSRLFKEIQSFFAPIDRFDWEYFISISMSISLSISIHTNFYYRILASIKSFCRNTFSCRRFSCLLPHDSIAIEKEALNNSNWFLIHNVLQWLLLPLLLLCIILWAYDKWTARRLYQTSISNDCINCRRDTNKRLCRDHN